MHSRRGFLHSLAGALVQAAAGPAEWRNRHPGMTYRRLGRTGYMVSEVVMGGNRISPDNFEHVLMAMDMGLNYLDTAPAYGQGASEKGYAAVFKARKPDTVFLTSKVSLWDLNRNKVFRDIFDGLPAPEQAKLRQAAEDEIARRHADDPDYICNYFAGQRTEIEEAALSNVMEKQYGRKIDRRKNYKQLVLDSVDQSLGRLGAGHLDLLMCPHGANTPYELLNFPEIFEAFEILKKAGKVRHLGVSSHTDPAGILEAAIQTKIYSAAMVAYNIVNHRYMRTALEKARQADLGVIAMKVARPVYHGRNISNPNDPRRVKMLEDAVPGTLKAPQKAYLWALRNPNLSAVISEMISSEHVKDNVSLAGRKAAA